MQGGVGCFRMCWACAFGHCPAYRHTSADPDDVEFWQVSLAYKGTDPRSYECGCWCRQEPRKPLIHKGRKP